MDRKLKILMIAYACDPAGGGEHWLGWGWASEVSQRHDVTLFTTSRGREALMPVAAERGIEIHYIDVPNWVRGLSGFPPGLGAWFRKIWWQKMALAQARKIHVKRPFDLTHQTTFHTFRVPFSCAKLGIPSVWGPVAGGESVPPGFDKYLGTAAASEQQRGLINRISLHLPWVRSSLKNASRIIASNRTTLEFLPASVHEKCVVISPNALREEDALASVPTRPASDTFNILFAGNCAPTRAMPLVFEALSTDFPLEWRMKVVGSGTALDFWKQEAARLGIAARIDFTGPVPREKLQEFYHEASLLVFPALRDSGGSALLEAMTLALPILTLDWGGPGEMVDKSCAVMVQPETPEQTVNELRAGLFYLATQPEAAKLLGKAARMRALEHFRWQEKANLVASIYNELLD